MDAKFSSATSPKLSYGENSYRSALSYHPAEDTHYYLGWSDSFSPTADLYQLTVTPQPPERSDVIELGAKWLLFDGDLALRTALYQATKHWERNGDLESTAAILTKKRRTKGIELEAAGRISERWELFSGLALMDATILEVAENINATTGVITYGNPEFVGKRARNTPRYTLNLWTTYKLTPQWKIGGGVEAKGDRQAVNPSSAGAVPTLNGSYHPNTAPSYARWDAMVAWERKDWTLRLNVKNLFDKLYWDSVYDNGGFSIPGTKRAVVLTGEFKF
jgi:catecholate siderophore receptor